jgi:hypothetical protein
MKRIITALFIAALGTVALACDSLEEPVPFPINTNEISDNWFDEMSKMMKDDTRRFRECSCALKSCVNDLSFATPALRRILAAHPELNSEIIDLASAYNISDGGCYKETP